MRRTSRWPGCLVASVFVCVAGVIFLYERYRPKPPVFTTVYTGHKWNVSAIAFTPDVRNFVTDGWDGQAMLWNPEETWPVRVFQKVPGALHTLALTPDGKTLFAVGDDTAVYRWPVTKTTSILLPFPLPGPAKQVVCSPDGRTLAVSGTDGIVHVMDAETGKEKYRVTETRGGKGAVAFAPDGKRLAAANERAVLLLDAATGKVQRRLDAAEVHLLRFAPDGKTLASGGYYTDILFWDTATWQPRARQSVRVLMAMTYSPDSQYLFTVEQTDLRRRDGRTGAEPLCVAGTCRDPNPPRWMTRLMPFLGPPRKEQFGPLAVSPDGRTLLYGSDAVVKRIKLEP